MNFIYLMTFFVTLYSCISPSSNPSARTLKKGENSYTLEVSNFSSYFFDKKKEEEKKVKEKLENLNIPFISAGINHGFLKKNEVGFQIGFPGTLNLNLKQNIINKTQYSFALSTGLGFAHIKYKYLFEYQRYKVYDIFLSFINSYDLNKNISINFNTNLIQRWHEVKTPKTQYREQNFFTKLSFGINLKYFYINHSYIFSPSKKQTVNRQISFGFWSGWNKTDRI